MTRSSFQGVVRSYGGQNKNSGVTPSVLNYAEVVTFSASTATATPISVGSTANGQVKFVLPVGAIPTSFVVIAAAGTTTTATVNIGGSANATSLAQNLVVGVKGIVQFTGASVVGTGLTANTTVYAQVGSTAGTGSVTGVFEYTVVDNGYAGEESGSQY